MPGILLHESTLWLAAGILKIRSERAIGFPAQQEIGELRLNFIRISPSSGPLRYNLAKLAPIGAGLLCLWLIALQVFNWQAVAAIAASGSIDDLARAISQLMRTADFWLWFYLAFTVANTMFPAPRQILHGRHKSALALAAGALILVIWWLGGEVEARISRGVESLLFSLALVMLQTIVINSAVVLILGALEAAIERVTGKSATFADGKMITMSRLEAQNQKAKQARERPAFRRRPQSKVKDQAITSIYDLKLPIPGPPGREPVSRSAVSIVNAPEDETNRPPRREPTSKPASLPRQSALERKQGPKDRQAPTIKGSASPVPAAKPAEPAKAKQAENKDAKIPEAKDSENAPFSRPFTHERPGRHDGDKDSDDDTTKARDEYFPRPFAMNTRAGSSDLLPAEPRANTRNDAESTQRNQRYRRSLRKTRPAPKPSASPIREKDRAPLPANDELTYEPLDDEDVYFDDDEDQGAAPLSS